MVYEEMCVSVKFSKVSAEAERLWTRILTKTDDNGNFHASPALVRGLCLPQLDPPLADVAKWIDELTDVGLVTPYESRGEQLLHITGFFKYQTLRKDRKLTIKHPAHPESFDEGVQGPATAGDDDYADEPGPANVPTGTSRPARSVLVGKPVVNQLATAGKPLVTEPLAEEKRSEEKISEVKLSKPAGQPASLPSSKPNTGGDWKTIAVKCKRQFGRIPGDARSKDNYAEACFKYSEDVVLAAFDEWAPGAGWVKEKGYDPLRMFLKALPDIADVLTADKELTQAEDVQRAADAAQAQKDQATREQQVAAARKADADKWDSMTKPSTDNEVSLADYLEEDTLAEKQ